MTSHAPKGWFAEMLEQLATQPDLLRAAAEGSSEQWDQRRCGKCGSSGRAGAARKPRHDALRD